MTPRAPSHQRAESGGGSTSLAPAAPIPTAPGTAQTSLTVGETTAGASVPRRAFPHSLTRFFDTLGMADDQPWRPAFEGEQPPF